MENGSRDSTDIVLIVIEGGQDGVSPYPQVMYSCD